MKQVAQIIQKAPAGRKPNIIKKARKRSSRPVWGKEREAQYDELVTRLREAGYVVRREELKRGHCWKVISGECRSLEQRFIFVDSRLSPDEQVAFLSVKYQEVRPSVPQPEQEGAQPVQ